MDIHNQYPLHRVFLLIGVIVVRKNTIIGYRLNDLVKGDIPFASQPVVLPIVKAKPHEQ
jgi:hypothetical protein